MSTGQPLSRVVVMGRDVELWLCVNAISRALRPGGSAGDCDRAPDSIEIF